MAQATKLAKRKLYTVRVFPTSTAYSKHVGHKGRLLPRRVAQRVLKRLEKGGKVEGYLSPLIVNCTPEQAAYLDRRYH
ncbi:hypothetical protein [Paraburkholderia sp. GAS32]|uniref:hypothetical protein n=1 Tax=Paraburkholderia sp. GAS32 TaxID=3035129 RepID=UPI003D1A7B78